MLKKLGIGLAALLALLLIIAAMQPDEFRIQRQTKIAAPTPVIFAMVNDFEVWDTWSPWAKLDPTMKKALSGPERGVGAVYEWSGNNTVGSGRMEIKDIRENERITIQLDFTAPFKATNTAEFTFMPTGPDTTVTWAMSGANNFMSKIMCLFMNMDKMIGPDFEKGLADLKRLAELKAQATS